MGSVNRATRGAADAFAEILRRRTGRPWIVVAGSALPPKDDPDPLGRRHLGSGVRGTADLDSLD